MDQKKDKKTNNKSKIKEIINSKRKKTKDKSIKNNDINFLFILIHQLIKCIFIFLSNFLNIKHSNFIKKNSIIILLLFSHINITKEFTNEINIVIRGTGTQKILSDYKGTYDGHVIDFNDLPDEILVNNVKQDISGKYVHGLTDLENKITMRWNHGFYNANGMFHGLQNITLFDFSNFNTKDIKSMMFMFAECRMRTLDLSNFKTYYVEHMAGMFECCYNLESLDVSHFDTSRVTNFDHLFRGLTKLTSLNVDSFDTSKAQSMVGMFEACYSLTSLNVKKFKTSNVKDMWCMFCYDNSLQFLDLSNFDTSSTTRMKEMFTNCYSLISLNINNFNYKKIEEIDQMFMGCNSLISLNLTNLFIVWKTSYLKIFEEFNRNTIICKKNNITKVLETELRSLYKFDCSDSCFTKSKNKFITKKYKCIDNCAKDQDFPFEYNNICYDSCPNGTIPLNGKKCIYDIKCSSSLDFLNNKCELNNDSNEIDEMIEKIKNDLKNGELNELIYHVIEDKKNIEIKNEDKTFQITTSKNQNDIDSDNISILKLGECETKIKDINNIDENSDLIIP